MQLPWQTREPTRLLTCVTLFRYHAPISLCGVKFIAQWWRCHHVLLEGWCLHEFVMADLMNPVNVLMKMNIGEAEGARESWRWSIASLRSQSAYGECGSPTAYSSNFGAEVTRLNHFENKQSSWIGWSMETQAFMQERRLFSRIASEDAGTSYGSDHGNVVEMNAMLLVHWHVWSTYTCSCIIFVIPYSTHYMMCSRRNFQQELSGQGECRNNALH